ncbi:hypothetical protein D5S18_01025 [Nocardia panacis]|uniref:Uncharacterized protein n=1 Tax=Nocardia panacis TaxID=2340916 RepID=A0A3A4L0F4_9NOCA|nr:hypothetical protein D5S18_01025 [Nocardia panacis]
MDLEQVEFRGHRIQVVRHRDRPVQIPQHSISTVHQRLPILGDEPGRTTAENHIRTGRSLSASTE